MTGRISKVKIKAEALILNGTTVIGNHTANGGFITSASHNPEGLVNGWGIKFYYSGGQPAPESIIDNIYGNILSISEIKMANISDADLSRLGATKFFILL